MSKVAIVGGGASGMIAAIKASENNEVILLESNDKCGKKLLLTGNGKCNYWNDNIICDNYYTDNYEMLETILKNKDEVLDYLYKLGLYPKVKNGYYYPYSSQASSVREILENELIRRNVKVLYNSKVIKINKTDKFNIYLEDDVINADKVIIATGSKAASKTGSDGAGYEFAKSFGHHINPVLPALAKLCANDWYFRDWNGVRQDARVTLFINNEESVSDEGELQMTQDGISGICTFNISSVASKALNDQKSVSVKINFVPFLKEKFYDFFSKRNEEINGQNISELLESILNYKLISIILKRCDIYPDAYWKSLTTKEKELLCQMVEAFDLKITHINDYEKAQVCTGGIPLKEVKNNMESTLADGLYIVGELLDVDGRCGGFNLAFVFITGFIAGSDIR